ncbi:MAG: preprotein translocase subunit SecG [Pirellulales bacterium]|nr:preprotein translocase subunit SecG [Pirellulales bacterium]
MSTLFMVVLLLLAVFMILLILVQKGKGGGLAGALGGAGGQSAFGTKAGDLFTKITIGVAITWILGCVMAAMLLKSGSRMGDDAGGLPVPAANAPADAPGGDAPGPAPKGEK